ncbi:MAG: hypothetical protein WCA15_09520 [Candidatus Acidiferrales bacterium]
MRLVPPLQLAPSLQLVSSLQLAPSLQLTPSLQLVLSLQLQLSYRQAFAQLQRKSRRSLLYQQRPGFGSGLGSGCDPRFLSNHR